MNRRITQSVFRKFSLNLSLHTTRLSGKESEMSTETCVPVWNVMWLTCEVFRASRKGAYCCALAHNAVVVYGDLRNERAWRSFLLKTARLDLLKFNFPHQASHMFPLFSSGSSFDSALTSSGVQNIEHEIKRINRLYVISGMALWFQQLNMIHLSENWSEIFQIRTDEIFLLEDYLVLIESPEERSRISFARELLISQSPGFEWCDTFTLRGQRVQTAAVVAQGCIFGMDRIVGRAKAER